MSRLFVCLLLLLLNLFILMYLFCVVRSQPPGLANDGMANTKCGHEEMMDEKQEGGMGLSIKMLHGSSIQCASPTQRRTDGPKDAMGARAHSLQNGSIRVIDNGSTWKE